MSEDAEDAIESVVAAIRHYFELYPDAADTVVGIQQWWLPAPLLDEPLPLVELALERLVEAGVVRRIEQRDGTVSYSSAQHGRPIDHRTDDLVGGAQ